MWYVFMNEYKISKAKMVRANKIETQFNVAYFTNKEIWQDWGL